MTMRYKHDTWAQVAHEHRRQAVWQLRCALSINSILKAYSYPRNINIIRRVNSSISSLVKSIHPPSKKTKIWKKIKFLLFWNDFRLFWAVLEKIFFHARKCITLFELDMHWPNGSCHTGWGWHNVQCIYMNKQVALN